MTLRTFAPTVEYRCRFGDLSGEPLLTRCQRMDPVHEQPVLFDNVFCFLLVPVGFLIKATPILGFRVGGPW